MTHNRARSRWAGATVAVAAMLLAVAAFRQVSAAPLAPAAPVDNYRRPAPAVVDLPNTPGDHRLRFRTKVGDHDVTMSYLLHLPPDYADPRVKSPVLVFLHGIGECGTDLSGVYSLGPMTMLRARGGNPPFAASCPFVVLCPQCPPRGQKWDDDFMYRAVAELIEQTVKNAKCDPDRVYVTGLSMGGLGTWCVGEEDPDALAAIAPLSAMKWQPETAGGLLKRVSVWCVAGVNDESRFIDGTREMQASLDRADVFDRFTYLTNCGHEAFFACYDSPQFYEWFLSHRRMSPGQKLNPATTRAATSPGHHLLTYEVKVGEQPYLLDYVLYVPKELKDKPGPHPAILYLHEADVMGPAYHDICVHGPDLELERQPIVQNNFPFVVIAPRLPIRSSWDGSGMKAALLALVGHVNETVPIDGDRVVVTGMNDGANAAWQLAEQAPDKFSAVVAVSTDGSFRYPGDAGGLMKKMPGRVYCKATDRSTADRFKAFAAQSKLDWKQYPLGPTATPLGDVTVYGEKSFVAWAEGQRRAK